MLTQTEKINKENLVYVKKTLQRMLTQTEKINKENLVYVKKHFREC
jgi:hypothetical protein